MVLIYLFPDSQITAKMTCGRTKASGQEKLKLLKNLEESFCFSIASDVSKVDNFFKANCYVIHYCLTHALKKLRGDVESIVKFTTNLVCQL